MRPVFTSLFCGLIAAVLFAAAQACAQQTPENFRWIDFHGPSGADHDIVTWVTRSLALEGVLNSALQHAGMSVTLGRTSLPVVDSMACPAVAVEIAPEMGPDKKAAAGLDDPDYQARVAEALAAALVEWRSEAHQP